MNMHIRSVESVAAEARRQWQHVAAASMPAGWDEETYVWAYVVSHHQPRTVTSTATTTPAGVLTLSGPCGPLLSVEDPS